MPTKFVVLAILSFITIQQECRAGVVFSSGTVPDLTDTTNFLTSDDHPFVTTYWNHTFNAGVPPAPVEVRSIEFYGFSIGAVEVPDPHGFQIVLNGTANVLGIERTVVAPVLEPLATPIYRYRVDIEPTMFDGTSNFYIRGDTPSIAEEWRWAVTGIATAGIVTDAYADSDLTILTGTFADSFFYNFYDNYQVVTTPDFDNDLDVDGIDFLIWQRGESPLPTSISDYNDWQEEFGTVSMLTAPTTIPEPYTMSLLALGLMCWGLCRSRHS